MARPLPTPYGPETRALKPNRRPSKKFLCSSSNPSADTITSMNCSAPDCIAESFSSTTMPAESTAASATADFMKGSKDMSSSVLLTPSAGLKLGHMLSLIRQEDVEFKQHALFTQIDFPSKDGESRVFHSHSARRLRSLIALAHHLDEEDRFLEVHPPSPTYSIPLSPAESVSSVDFLPT